MRTRFSDGTFRYLGNEAFNLLPPNVVIRAAAVSSGEFNQYSDLLNSNVDIPVVFEKTDGTRYEFTIRLFKHPSGAGTITIATQSTGSDGRVTHTPTKEGYALATDGTLLLNTDEARGIAGFLFTDYFTEETHNLEGYENFHCTTLEEGDYYFLVVGGKWNAYSDNSPTVGRAFIGSTTAGQISMAGDFDTSSVAALSTSLRNNNPGPRNFFCGTFLSAPGAAGLADVWIVLPPKH